MQGKLNRSQMNFVTSLLDSDRIQAVLLVVPGLVYDDWNHLIRKNMPKLFTIIMNIFVQSIHFP